MKKHTVLISYSFQDQSLADKVALALRSKDIDCWIAHENIRPTENWPEVILKAIHSCELFLLILTNNSNNSRQVIRELTEADNSNKNCTASRWRISLFHPVCNISFRPFTGTKHTARDWIWPSIKW